jgi:hypothetical protein
VVLTTPALRSSAGHLPFTFGWDTGPVSPVLEQEEPMNEDEQRQLAAACRDLVVEFGELPESDVEARFGEIVRRYDEAPIRSFIPVLVQREARAQLRQLTDS